MDEFLKSAYKKAAAYCAYRERTQDEVRKKLDQLHVLPDDAEELISQLIQDNYLSEERFAKTFAGGKFRIKKWGRLKINQALKQKQLSEYCIHSGLKEIPDKEYIATLQKLAVRKMASLKDPHPLLKKQKTARYLLQKGYESELVWKVIGEM